VRAVFAYESMYSAISHWQELALSISMIGDISIAKMSHQESLMYTLRDYLVSQWYVQQFFFSLLDGTSILVVQ
jgi:predicted ATPase